MSISENIAAIRQQIDLAARRSGRTLRGRRPQPRDGHYHLLRNLLIVWLATGLWHGASWNYVLWGLYFGILICAEKLLAPILRGRVKTQLPEKLYRPVSLLLAL